MLYMETSSTSTWWTCWAKSILWPHELYSMIQKEILKEIKRSKIFKTKGTPKSVCMYFTSTSVLTANEKKQKPERTHPPNLVHMHFTSTFTCMNFLSRFYFLTPWTIMSMVWKWNLKDKRSKTYETQETLHM